MLESLYPTALNSAITIPASATNCQNMFFNCVNYNNTTTVPSNVSDCSNMFCSATRTISVRFPKRSESVTDMNIAYMLPANNTFAKYVYCNSSDLAKFSKAAAGSSLIGGTITWITRTNYYYNAYYNLYLYYNYAY